VLCETSNSSKRVYELTPFFIEKLENRLWESADQLLPTMVTAVDVIAAYTRINNSRAILKRVKLVDLYTQQRRYIAARR